MTQIMMKNISLSQPLILKIILTVEVGMVLRTKDKYEFTLNFDYKFPELVVPGDAKAIYANCGDLIPIIDTIKTTNVGGGYTQTFDHNWNRS